MSKSLVIDLLNEGTVEAVNSAITIIDGTELFNNSEYQIAKQNYKRNKNVTNFVFTVRSLYKSLGKAYGLDMGE